MTHAVLPFCFFLGFLVGLRSLTAPAAVCWGARLGWLHFGGTKFAFLGHPVTLVIFTLAALGELVADKLPNTPARTAPSGLVARILFGALCGVALAVSAGVSTIIPAIVGVLGALIGTYGGYHTRHALVTRMHVPDLIVALVEDVIAVGGSLFIVSHV